MIEGKRVVAGDAILSGLVTTDRSTTDSRMMERSNAASGRVESREEALESLVREHSRMVYRIAYAVLRSHHDAEDATQETFVRVLRYRANLAEIQEPKAWLARIAWRVAVDRSKLRGRTREIPLESEKPSWDVASAGVSVDESLQGSQMGSALQKLILALPSKLRQPLLLSAIEEMSPREVASALAISEAAVRSRVFRARRILKEKLTQQAGRK
jgi:RNA polymerase sigma-70 factor, ECF subfamily